MWQCRECFFSCDAQANDSHTKRITSKLLIKSKRMRQFLASSQISNSTLNAWKCGLWHVGVCRLKTGGWTIHRNAMNESYVIGMLFSPNKHDYGWILLLLLLVFAVVCLCMDLVAQPKIIHWAIQLAMCQCNVFGSALEHSFELELLISLILFGVRIHFCALCYGFCKLLIARLELLIEPWIRTRPNSHRHFGDDDNTETQQLKERIVW